MSTLETVKIINPKDKKSFLIINKIDFDPKKDKIWEETEKAPVEEDKPKK